MSKVFLIWLLLEFSNWQGVNWAIKVLFLNEFWDDNFYKWLGFDTGATTTGVIPVAVAVAELLGLWLVVTLMLWIFFMWTFKWSVRLNTWPQVLQGWGTNLPWCWWRTCLRRVHFKLKIRAHIAHWNLGPSGVWHMVYTESVLVNLLSRLLGGEAWPEPAPTAVMSPTALSPRSGQGWPGRPGPPSETREGVTVETWQIVSGAGTEKASRDEQNASFRFLYNCSNLFGWYWQHVHPNFSSVKELPGLEMDEMSVSLNQLTNQRLINWRIAHL